MIADSYARFLESKLALPPPTGIVGARVDHGKLSDWQQRCVEWSLERGRAALFEDCGLGKGRQQITWAREAVEYTRGRALILAPLAVAQQTVREGDKIGVPVRYANDQAGATEPITVTNYERLDRFDPDAFDAVVLDESSILKNYSGSTKRRLVANFARTPFRLCATATPAPNDHLELGNHAEFLGVLTSHEMIARWFLPDTSTFGTYRLKGHAVSAFWDWVASWARCLGKPSDLGPEYSDEGYELPPLEVIPHAIGVDVVSGRENGALFRVPTLSATAVHREKRITAASRARQVAELALSDRTEPWICWCDTDYESVELKRAIPEAVEVRGPEKLEQKEAALLGFENGSIRVLITKPSIAGFGLNWQHCARQAWVGPTFSFERFYQGVRRSHRFGQKRPVKVHVVMAQTEVEVWSVQQQKAAEHEAMKREMFGALRRAQAKAERHAYEYEPRCVGRLPDWLQARQPRRSHAA